jgi:hypothetical protein
MVLELTCEMQIRVVVKSTKLEAGEPALLAGSLVS